MSSSALWAAQGILAVTFLASGWMKSTLSRERLVASGQTGVEGLPRGFIRFIGASELAGAVGLVLPWLSGIARFLTPAAAGALAIVMVAAAFVHSRRREPRNVLVNLVLLAACAFVAYGRARQLGG